MTEEKKENKENKAEEAINEVKEKETITFDRNDMSENTHSGANADKFELEELPDDVKKKLEAAKKDKKTPTKGKKKKKRTEKNVSVGKAYIKASYNNTIVSLADSKGNILSWASAGMAGFKGPKKSTPYAAQIITRIAVEKAREAGLKEVSVFVKGVGTGRESAVRALNANGLNVTYIKDITPVPHNGCRPKKPRRV